MFSFHIDARFMRKVRKHCVGFIFGLLILFSTLSLLTPVKRTWLRSTGAVIPNDSRTDSYTEKGVRILSVTGERWVTWDREEKASAYYALVILPRAAVKNIGFVSGDDGFTHTNIEKWLWYNDRPYEPMTEQKQLQIDYDAMWQTITVDSRAYNLSKGNLFVIRFDEGWKHAVTQLGVTINWDAAHEDIINAFKSVLPEDKLIQGLP